jgi:hypothetical protein
MSQTCSNLVAINGMFESSFVVNMLLALFVLLIDFSIWPFGSFPCLGDCLSIQMEGKSVMGRDTYHSTWWLQKQILYLLVGRLMQSVDCLFLIRFGASTWHCKVHSFSYTNGEYIYIFVIEALIFPRKIFSRNVFRVCRCLMWPKIFSVWRKKFL